MQSDIIDISLLCCWLRNCNSLSLLPTHLQKISPFALWPVSDPFHACCQCGKEEEMIEDNDDKICLEGIGEFFPEVISFAGGEHETCVAVYGTYSANKCRRVTAWDPC